jgi:hypothetical protein
MQTDNSTALSIVTHNIQPRRTKAMDMRFHWLRCRKAQQQFRFFWQPGDTNLADYWTKHHCAAHHVEQRHHYLTPRHIVTSLRESKKRNPAPLLTSTFTAAAA